MRKGDNLPENLREKADEEILALSLEKPSVFEVLIDRYEDAFLRKSLFLLGNKEDAEDAVQECFMKIYFHAGRYRKQEGVSWSSWGYRILVNTCFSIYKKRKQDGQGRIFLEDEIMANLPDRGKEGESAMQEYECEDTRNTVLSFLSRLPSSAARVLRMHFILGMKQKEIAWEEGVSIEAIKVRIFRAKKELRKLYENHTPNS